MEKTEQAKDFIVYWHKMANSGVWEYNKSYVAFNVAKDLAKQEGVFRVVVYDLLRKEKMVIKEDKE